MTKRACGFPDCNRRHHSHGYCGGHARQFRLGQTLRPLTRNAISQEQRFWDKVDKTDTCWLWTGAKAEGYGVIRLASNQRLKAAHIVSFRMAGRVTPEGMELDHLCRVRACVNPDHLEAVTHAENVARVPWGVKDFQAAKTHCPQGHEYSPENTRHRRNSSGTLSRECKTCIAARARARNARKREARKRAA